MDVVTVTPKQFYYINSEADPRRWSWSWIDMDSKVYTVVSPPQPTLPQNSQIAEVPTLIDFTSPGVFFRGKADLSTLTANKRYEVAVTVMLLQVMFGWQNRVTFNMYLPDGSIRANHLFLYTFNLNQWETIQLGDFTPTTATAGQEVNFEMVEYGQGSQPTGINYKGLIIKNVVVQPVGAQGGPQPQAGKEVIVEARRLLFPSTAWSWIETRSKSTYVRTSANNRSFAAIEVGYINPRSPGFAHINIRGRCEMSKLTANARYHLAFYYTMFINSFPVTFKVDFPDGSSSSSDLDLRVSPMGQLEALVVGDFVASSAAGVINFSINERNPAGQYGVALLIHSVVFHPI